MNQQSLYYCSNCEFKIINEQEYKAHYRSDFHRYNLKRKNIGLCSVSYDIFQQKFLIESKSNTSCQSSKDQTYGCLICNKVFYSNGTYVQHMNSQKHKDTLKSNEKQKKQQIDIQSFSSESLIFQQKSAVQDDSVCLFCNQQFDDRDDSLMHMNIKHGFFIRELESVIELDGLLNHLAKIINLDYSCLYCFKLFNNRESTQQHMLDKNHCFMPKQEFDELSHYYDHKQKLKQLLIIQEEDDDNLQLNDKENQDNVQLDSEGEFEIINLTQEQLRRRKELDLYLLKIRNQKAHMLSNGEQQLPNGKIIGHRSLRRHYRQNHIPAPNNPLRILQSEDNNRQKLVN